MEGASWERSTGEALENDGERRERELDNLRNSAETDSLTGLLNRRGFEDHVERLRDNLEQTRRAGDRKERQIVCVLGDLDKFKKINDSFGHETGDKVLRAVARCLRDNVRVGDVVGRWGGEEIILALVVDEGISAERIVEDLRIAVEHIDIVHDGKRVPVTMSFGIADEENLANNDTADAVSDADKALYAAKGRGRNRAVSFSRLTPEEVREAA